MKNFAFKRTKNCPIVAQAQHPESIVEWADCTLFPPDFHKPADGWEIMPEDVFQADLARNEARAIEWEEMRGIKEQELHEALREEAKSLANIQHNKDFKLFQEFLRWQEYRSQKGKR